MGDALGNVYIYSFTYKFPDTFPSRYFTFYTLSPKYTLTNAFPTHWPNPKAKPGPFCDINLLVSLLVHYLMYYLMHLPAT